MKAGGTATTPSTTRSGRHEYEPTGSMMLSHDTVGGDPDGEANADRPGKAKQASATKKIEERMGRADYTSGDGAVPEVQRSSARSLGSANPNLR